MSIRPHAFVVMPFGKKPYRKDEVVDFNRVYSDFIQKALIEAGLEPFRADQEMRGGEIRTDMFQELLLADLVIADLTIDNPNVWYELGVRHALRARGVVLISGGEVPKAFDIYTDRKLSYGLANGGPDPATLDEDKARLVKMIQTTMESWHGRKVSPVYSLLPHLQEPNWKSLRVGDVREIWEQHENWTNRLELARQGGAIGDMLVLAEEGPVAPFRAEAWTTSGSVLRRAGRFVFALDHLEKALGINPVNLLALQEKGMCLQRLGLLGRDGHSTARARTHYRSVLETFPRDTETWALLGRVEKDAWTSIWQRPGRPLEQMRAIAADQGALLGAAIVAYERAYQTNPAHYFSGINALTLMHLARHLTNDTSYDSKMEMMAGAIRFAAQCEPDEKQLFWAKATLGDVEVLMGTPETVKKKYREAIAKSERNWFWLDSVRQQVVLLNDVGFRPDTVSKGLTVLDEALVQPPEAKWEPRTVFLFSGHMIDAQDRAEPRFPSEKEPAARARIAAALDELGAGPDDIAFSQAASGGDLLFIEACLEREVRSRVYLPFAEPEFIKQSIDPSANGSRWRSRFYAMKPRLASPMLIMPTELGAAPKHVNPFERCNLWLLYSALACGVDRVQLITLWNGSGGDGPGGTKHMYDEVRDRTGRVTWIDTREL